MVNQVCAFVGFQLVSIHAASSNCMGCVSLLGLCECSVLAKFCCIHIVADLVASKFIRLTSFTVLSIGWDSAQLVVTGECHVRFVCLYRWLATIWGFISVALMQQVQCKVG